MGLSIKDSIYNTGEIIKYLLTGAIARAMSDRTLNFVDENFFTIARLNFENENSLRGMYISLLWRSVTRRGGARRRVLANL